MCILSIGTNIKVPDCAANIMFLMCILSIYDLLSIYDYIKKFKEIEGDRRWRLY